MRIDHVGVVVSNTERSVEFYRRVLGAEVADSHGDESLQLTFLTLGGQVIELVQHLDREHSPRERGPVDHIALLVDDLDFSLARALAAGAAPQMPEPKTVGNKKIMFVSGPDGERLEFVQVVG